MHILIIMVCALVVSAAPFMSAYAGSDEDMLSQWTSDDGPSADEDPAEDSAAPPPA